MNGKVIIFCAPSGSGKSTVVHHLLNTFDCFDFSVSAASRAPRATEKDGVDYHFMTNEEFNRLVEADEFVEHEEVYPGCQYGTLKSEVRRIWSEGHVILFDVDVKGGVNLKRYFGDMSLSIFLKAPSIAELRKRLEKRGTDSPEAIDRRVAKAAEELKYAPQFDTVVVNDDLETCLKETVELVKSFLEK